MCGPTGGSGYLESRHSAALHGSVSTTVEVQGRSTRRAIICRADSNKIAAKRKKRYDTGMTPNKNTPLNAPSVVAVSNVMASRMFVRRPRRNGAALPHEQAITETMLAPIAT